MNRLTLDFHLDSELSSPQGATYLDYSGIIKHSRDQYSVVVGQQKHLEVFRINMESEARPVASASGFVGSGEDLAQNQGRLSKNKDLRSSQTGFGQYAQMANNTNELYGLSPAGYMGNTRRASNDKKRFLPNPAMEPDSPYLRFRSPSKKLIDYRKSLTENPDSPLIKSSEETPEPSLKSGKEPSNYQDNAAEKMRKGSEYAQRERSPRMSGSRETKPSRFSQQRLPDDQTHEANRPSDNFLLTRPDRQSMRANSKQVVDINQAISEFSEESRNDSSINDNKKLRKQSSQKDIPAVDGKVHTLRTISSIHRGFSDSLKPKVPDAGSPKNSKPVEVHLDEFTLRKDSFKISPQLAVESGRRGSDPAGLLVLPELKRVSGLLGRRKETFEGCPHIDLDVQQQDEEVPAVEEHKPEKISYFSPGKQTSKVQPKERAGEDQLKIAPEVQTAKESPSKRLPTSEDQSTRQIQPAVTDLQVPPRSPVTSSLSVGAGVQSRRSREVPDPVPPFDRQPSSISDISSET